MSVQLMLLEKCNLCRFLIERILKSCLGLSNSRDGSHQLYLENHYGAITLAVAISLF
jgi:hypothetical protein